MTFESYPYTDQLAFLKPNTSIKIITDKSQLQSLKMDYTVVLPHNQFTTIPLVMDCWSWFLTMQFPVKEASKIVKIITLNQHHPL